jgi:hypothetical protein
VAALSSVQDSHSAWASHHAIISTGAIYGGQKTLRNVLAAEKNNHQLIWWLGTNSLIAIFKSVKWFFSTRVSRWLGLYVMNQLFHLLLEPEQPEQPDRLIRSTIWSIELGALFLDSNWFQLVPRHTGFPINSFTLTYPCIYSSFTLSVVIGHCTLVITPGVLSI